MSDGTRAATIDCFKIGVTLIDKETDKLYSLKRRVSPGVWQSEHLEAIQESEADKYTVLEVFVLSPDGFPIERDKGYLTKQEGFKAFKEWVKQYKKQGYYSSVKYGRIPYDEIGNYCEFV